MTTPAERSIGRELWDLALPIIGINVLNVLALTVDTMMCARLPNAEVALAALGYATTLTFLLMTAVIGLMVGTVALVSRAHGAGEHGRVDHILLQSTQLVVLIGLAVATLGNLAAGPLLTLLGASEAARAEGLRYLFPLLSAASFTYLTFLYGAVFRGIGHTLTPFLLALFTNVLNVVLNYGLILGHLGMPALGVEGAGIGTGISYALTAVLYVVILNRPNGWRLHLPVRPARIDPSLTREFFNIGAPAAADVLVLNVSFLGVIGMIARLDEVAVAAHNIGIRIQGLAFVPGMSISQAAGALIGQSLGASDVARTHAVVRATIVQCLVIMCFFGVLFIVFAGPLVALFDAPPGSALELLSIEWILILGYGMPIYGFHVAWMAVLQGSGATGTSLRINIISTLALQLPIGWLLAFPFDLGVAAVWWSFNIGFALKAILEGMAYKAGGWAKTGVHVETGDR